MNEVVIKVTFGSELTTSTKSILNQRHETHLQMEDSTYQQLESVPYEWSQETNITLTGK